MSQVDVTILLDSINPYNGVRLTTYVLRYPRVMHSELMTHRSFSKSASSSRAIPFKRMAELVDDAHMYLPPVWGWNQPGMQQKDEPCPPDIVAKADAIVRKMRDAAIAGASELNALGIHKQYCNRYLEPFGHIAVVLTATDFDNFFTLRSHPAALPDIQILSDKMLEAYVSSTPVARMAHLPFLNTEELTDDYTLNAKRSSARCARVSYLNHEGKVPTLEEDMKLYDRLMAEVPRHSSPTEHIARVLDPVHGGLRADAYSGNIRGWHQFRKSIVDECIRSTDLGALLARPNRPHERAAV